MRVLQLSDHPGAMLHDAQRRRAAGDREMRLAHEKALATHRQYAARARDARDQAWAQRRWGAWLRGVFAVWRAGRPVSAARLPASQPTDEEQRLAAGAVGERLVADALGQVLDDEWALVRGYRNRRGRSPSVQLNEPASQLEDFLRSRRHPVAIGRIVVLTHPRAQLRSCTRPTVQVCTSVRQILDLLNASQASISAAERAELERLIVQDHRFHEKHRRRPG